jgi:hypothetical protein
MQNYTTEANVPKTLKLSATVVHSEVVETQLTLPYFCKDQAGDYFFIESESKVTRVRNFDAINLLSVSVADLNYWKSDILKAVAITEEEFTNLLTYAVTGLMTPAA